MDDNTPIWFGEHKGEKLANVPAKYLLWWNDANPSPSYEKGQALKKYIADNIQQLTAEAALKSR